MLVFQYFSSITAVLHHCVLHEQHCGGEWKVILEETSSEFSGSPEGMEERSFMEITSIRNTVVHNCGPEET